ncbi:hypothetical protein EWM64_g2588 [Hericium alpestre]|uniref:NAD(P)-binding protein n=1 Tax=Hericium alpestre TaxID=135208 RepID=A0A4Z0A517_9AGAM|nr:hypothetical protein EWM64_g2588 [Hericium alpestre]
MSQTTYTRVALVTGGAQGIGRAIALRLAADGLDVAVNDVERQSDNIAKVVIEIRALGRQAIAVPADVTSEEAVERMVAETVQQLGRLDVMVANAGVAHGGVGPADTPIVEMSLKNWQNLTAVNVEGVMLCYKHAARQMIRQGQGGQIIGASSICGKKGVKNLSAYCSSKFAVRALTQCAAAELAEHNITVNAYAPGVIDTPMTNLENVGGVEKLKITLGLPGARTGYPDDIAQFVSYAASPQSHFMTGALCLPSLLFDPQAKRQRSGQSVILDGGKLFD